MRWRVGDRSFELEAGPLVMGILNVTPDSFSDGGRYFEPRAAIARGLALLEEGADLVDLGGESTRPGSAPVAPEEQWRRIEPVLQELARDPRTAISVDTASAWVAERAVGAGAVVINDVTALGDPGMGAVAASSGAGVVLMHMQGTPADMQRDPRYGDPAEDVFGWLSDRIRRAAQAGIDREAVAVDPGIGFGKSVEHNLRLLARLDRLAELERPIVVGVSRKSFLGKLLDDAPIERRLEGGLGAAAVAVFQGAHVVRTHDVGPTRRAVRLAAAIRRHA